MSTKLHKFFLWRKNKLEHMYPSFISAVGLEAVLGITGHRMVWTVYRPSQHTITYFGMFLNSRRKLTENLEEHATTTHIKPGARNQTHICRDMMSQCFPA